MPGSDSFSKKINIFLSHESSHREFVHEVALNLEVFGFSPFVAHTSIEPSSEWQIEIERQLRGCDVGCAFLHESFKSSEWCDQEIGWMAGRGIPIVPIAIDMFPYGPISKIQAVKTTNLNSEQIADQIRGVIAREQSLEGRYIEAIVSALENSQSYNQTKKLIQVLPDFAKLTSLQTLRLQAASTQNSQITECFFSSGTAASWILKKISTEPSNRTQ